MPLETSITMKSPSKTKTASLKPKAFPSRKTSVYLFNSSLDACTVSPSVPKVDSMKLVNKGMEERVSEGGYQKCVGDQTRRSLNKFMETLSSLYFLTTQL